MNKIHLITILGMPNKKGMRVIYFRISFNGQKKKINSGIKVLKSEWNSRKSLPKDPVIKHIIEEKYSEIQKLIYQMELEKKPLEWLLSKIERKSTGKFYDAGMDHVEDLKQKGKYGNANTYKGSINQFERFSPGLNIGEVTEAKAKAFIDFKKSKISNNGVRQYVKTLRALFNVFIKKGLISSNPFVQPGILPPYTITRKRNITKEQMKLVRDCDTYATDIFYLLFLLRGMDLVDLANLTKDNIEGDYIYYFRDKLEFETYEMQVKIFPEAARLIEKYKGENMLVNIIDAPKTESLKFHKKYRTAIKDINDGLNVTAEVLEKKVTTKFARHSFATIGKMMGYSKDLVGEMLGHSGGTITDVYLDRYDQHIVDAAHKAIINLD